MSEARLGQRRFTPGSPNHLPHGCTSLVIAPPSPHIRHPLSFWPACEELGEGLHLCTSPLLAVGRSLLRWQVLPLLLTDPRL